ncbi:hypothetical protein ACJIZ3_020586 [Penstemon smallii]|uniref:ZF-HD dimerization-type domain-containing protein n=1 Tax=Penstemon smallii TaxID=265156 RepID=A0ABD3SJS2_9LAMI
MDNKQVIYEECCKIHPRLGDKTDGCQEFMWRSSNLECAICGCHRNFHRKVVERAPVRYTECHKIHVSKTGENYVDGCKEFRSDINRERWYGEQVSCAACKCHKSFHRNEIKKEVITPFSSTTSAVKKERT